MKKILARWRLIPAVDFYNWNTDPHCPKGLFRDLFKIRRAWGGRIISIHVKQFMLTLDFRRNWLADFAGLTRCLILFALFAFSAVKAEAQLLGFGSGQPVIGSTNSAAVDTNTSSINVKHIGFNLSGMTNASTSFTGTVYLSTSPTSIANALALGQMINNGSNNASFSFQSTNQTVPLYILLGGGSGTNTTFVQAIYGP